MKTPLSELREEYTHADLDKTGVDPDPLKQFQVWLQDAVEAGLPEPNAMTLATVGLDGMPAARIVLLKGLDSGFVFYTSYESDKAQQLAREPRAALLFLWNELERQVRIEGVTAPIAAEESDAYFTSRPRNSRLGALASHQSQVVANRGVLEARFAELEQQYAGQDVPRPSHWGGYRLVPTLLEFWQGRPSRLHDRLRYRRQDDGSWQIERLEP